MREKSCLKHTRRFQQLHRVRLTCRSVAQCPASGFLIRLSARIADLSSSEGPFWVQTDDSARKPDSKRVYGRPESVQCAPRSLRNAISY